MTAIPPTEPVEKFLHYLGTHRGRSAETVRTYSSTLCSFEQYAGGNLLAADVGEVQAWWDSLHELDKDGKPKAQPRTRARMLSAVRSFYKWAIRFDYVDRDPTRRLDPPTLPKGKPRYVTRDQLDILRAKLEPDMKRAALLGAWAGLRVSEVAALMWADVDEELMHLNIHHGKGDKGRSAGMAPLLYDALCPRIPGGNVVTGTALVYSASALQRRINRAMLRVGVDATFHQLRHRFGTITYGATGDPLAVAAAMGHASLETTRIYAAVSDDALARVAAAAVR